MSLRKLKKLGDPEKLLRKAVLINNTLECLRNGDVQQQQKRADFDVMDGGYESVVHSKYSVEEELILNRVMLPNDIVTCSSISTTASQEHDDNENQHGEVFVRGSSERKSEDETKVAGESLDYFPDEGLSINDETSHQDRLKTIENDYNNYCFSQGSLCESSYFSFLVVA